MEPSLPSDLIGTAEAAEILNVRPQTIRQWIKGGRLTGYRIGVKHLRTSRSAVEALAVAPDGSGISREEHIRRIVDTAPPLTATQITALTDMLRNRNALA
ncbi:helix-turn-helix domain-containing protein [Rhodococcus aetherivorans]|uniref:helix-turn-helix domain-containing protein n=1 Tax=Rhodococcus aetherivorans TaxID=191292 RepID=UPI00055D3E23|nr:helix-turn-helix domain-containing protein [Rhodococcus aetherivorans]